jgi:undecaprenyl-diphosphatase
LFGNFSFWNRFKLLVFIRRWRFPARSGEGPAPCSLPLIAGTLSAALVGFFAIRIMLRIVRDRSLPDFAVYTWLLGVLILVDRFGTHLAF